MTELNGITVSPEIMRAAEQGNPTARLFLELGASLTGQSPDIFDWSNGPATLPFGSNSGLGLGIDNGYIPYEVRTLMENDPFLADSWGLHGEMPGDMTLGMGHGFGGQDPLGDFWGYQNPLNDPYLRSLLDTLSTIRGLQPGTAGNPITTDGTPGAGEIAFRRTPAGPEITERPTNREPSLLSRTRTELMSRSLTPGSAAAPSPEPAPAEAPGEEVSLLGNILQYMSRGNYHDPGSRVSSDDGINRILDDRPYGTEINYAGVFTPDKETEGTSGTDFLVSEVSTVRGGSYSINAGGGAEDIVLRREGTRAEETSIEAGGLIINRGSSTSETEITGRRSDDVIYDELTAETTTINGGSGDDTAIIDLRSRRIARAEELNINDVERIELVLPEHSELRERNGNIFLSLDTDGDGAVDTERSFTLNTDGQYNPVWENETEEMRRIQELIADKANSIITRAQN